MTHSNDRCDCGSESRFKADSVAEKVKRDLVRVAYGPNFGDVLCRCRLCGQWWEENLSEATYHDWPPILVKMSDEEVRAKYGAEVMIPAGRR